MLVSRGNDHACLTCHVQVQSKPPGTPLAECRMMHVAAELYRHSPARFFSGFGACMIRSFPASAVTFSCYELCLKGFDAVGFYE
jgi:hypothetical protein